ncbi:MAG: molybdenum cofactor biosynthesis protein MoaE [Spirochaetes bacterium]|nr:molybdenum cofactor biosynthesis protein MoaE [Spirochaetota bacterium]
MVQVVIQQEPIDITRVTADAGTDSDGAVVVFIGRARNNSNGRTVTRLEYEIYDGMAHKELRKAAEDASARWSLNSCIVVHRYGPVAIGEASIIIATSAPHRDNAFEAAQYIIDTVKEKVPIWKKEYYSDGSSWIHETE